MSRYFRMVNQDPYIAYVCLFVCLLSIARSKCLKTILVIMFYLVYLRVDLLEWELEYDVLYFRNFLISDNTFPQAVLNFAVYALLLKLLITRDVYHTEWRYLSPQSLSWYWRPLCRCRSLKSLKTEKDHKQT